MKVQQQKEMKKASYGESPSYDAHGVPPEQMSLATKHARTCWPPTPVLPCCYCARPVLSVLRSWALMASVLRSNARVYMVME